MTHYEPQVQSEHSVEEYTPSIRAFHGVCSWLELAPKRPGPAPEPGLHAN